MLKIGKRNIKLKTKFINLILLILLAATEIVKGAVARDFRPQFFSLIVPIWVPDKQAKMIFLNNSFSRRYLNLMFEKFDSSQANTARSRIFLTS